MHMKATVNAVDLKKLLKLLFLPERDMHLSNVIIAVFISWLLSLQNDSTDAKVTGISFEGCFKNLSHYTTRHNLSDKNDPRHCFDECNNTEYIGLQTQECFCNATRGSYATERACSYLCPGDSNFLCGSDNTIYVYYYTEQLTIDVDGEFGFVYLFLAGGSNRYEIHGTNNITKTRHYICYDDPSKCVFKSFGVEKTWQDAKSECLVHNQGLAPFRIAKDESMCNPALPDRYFWIGMSWFKTVNISTTTISTSTTATSASSTAASTSTTAISTSFTSSKPTLSFKTTTGLRTNHTSDTLQTPKDSSRNGINVIAVAVPVVAAILAVVVAIVLICWKRKMICFKPRHTSHADHVEKNHNRVQTGKINNDSPPETPYIDPLIDVNVSSCVPSGSNQTTFQGHQENIRPIVSLQTCNQEGHYLGSNAEKYEREMGNSSPNYLEGGSEKPGNSFELDDGIHSPASKTEKGKGKRRRKKKKQNHSVPAASKNGEINSDTDNYAELDRYKSGEHSVRNERKGNPNDESRYDEKKRTEKEIKNRDYSNEEQRSTSSKPFAALDPNIQFDRCATASDIHATVPTVQDKITDCLHGSDEVHDELNTNNSESRIEQTKKHKRSGKRKKRNKNTLFDVPADHPVVEGQTDINNIGSIIRQNEN